MPDVVCCVFKQGDSANRWKHTGIHIGNGKIIHCSGQVSRDTTKNKTWTHYAVPKGLYTDKELSQAGVLETMTTLKKGSKGEDVKLLQESLQWLGLYHGEIDGKFGSGTETAVKAFQSKYNLKIDGKVGDETWTKLLALQVGDNEIPDPVEPTYNAEEMQEVLRDIAVRISIL